MASPVQLKVLLDLSDGATFNETSADCYDVSDIVMTAHTRRGRSRELDKIEAGYSVITVIDENGDFNPDNSGSPYYGKLKPGNKIRLYPLYDDGTGEFRYPDIFTGYITNYLNRFSMGVNSANEVAIEANDAFKIFNSYSITDVVNSTTGDSSDERINAILDEISWPSPMRSFETSALSLGADSGDLRTVLDAIRQVEDTEAGLFYMDGSGVAKFINRTTVNVPPNIEYAYIFSDDGTETTYNGITFSQNDTTLINRVTVRSYDSTTQVTVYDSTSETLYFSRAAERNNVLLTATSDLTDLANQLLANFKDSSVDIESIILNLTDYQQIDRVIAALYFDLFFIPISVSKTMANNTVMSRLGWVQGVNHDITPTSWMVTAFTGLTEPAPLSWFNEAGSSVTFTKVFSDSTKAVYGELSDYSGTALGLVKFDAAGNLVWQKKFYPSTSSSTVARNFRLDNNNNLYGFNDTRLWKISSSGSEIWSKTITWDNDYIIGIDIDPDDNIYCVLSLGTVIALDSSGAILWQIETYDNYDTNSYIDYLNNIRVTDAAIYLSGYVRPYPDTGLSGLIIKLDLSGNLVWRYKINSASTLTTFLQTGLYINTTNDYIYTAITSSVNDGTSILTISDAGASASIVSQALYASSYLVDGESDITIDNDGNHLITLDATAISHNPYISLTLDDTSALIRSFTIFNGTNPSGNSEGTQTVQVYSPNKNYVIYGGKRVIGKFAPSITLDKTLSMQTIQINQVTETLSSASWTLASDTQDLETPTATIADFTSSNQDLAYTYTLYVA
jgi:hypothetical protein